VALPRCWPVRLVAITLSMTRAGMPASSSQVTKVVGAAQIHSSDPT
jgi:hypothetical protein